LDLLVGDRVFGTAGGAGELHNDPSWSPTEITVSAMWRVE
jgi:hypothetical protein